MKNINSKSGRTKFDYIYIILETLILISGVFQTLFGETAIGLMTLIAMALILYPHVMTGGRIQKFPREITIIFFIMVYLQLVLGEANDWYVNVPYYDKLVHFMLPMFTGFLAFLVFYTMKATGNLVASTKVTIVLVVFLALGIGALWEIFEYSNDRWLLPYMPNGHEFQGNAEQSKIDDTMTDLIDDTLGGIFGALLAVWFTTRAEMNDSKHLKNMTSGISSLYEKPQKKKKK